LALTLEVPDEDRAGWAKLLVDRIAVEFALALEDPDEDGADWTKLLEDGIVVALVLEDTDEDERGRTTVLEDELSAVGWDHELEELGAVGWIHKLDEIVLPQAPEDEVLPQDSTSEDDDCLSHEAV